MNLQLKPVGLSLAKTPCDLRDVRLHDGSPAEHTNVLSSDCVGMTSAATRHTTQGGLIGAIRLVRRVAGRTSLAHSDSTAFEAQTSRTCGTSPGEPTIPSGMPMG
jgi:hypothetical protein